MQRVLKTGQRRHSPIYPTRKGAGSTQNQPLYFLSCPIPTAQERRGCSGKKEVNRKRKRTNRNIEQEGFGFLPNLLRALPWLFVDTKNRFVDTKALIVDAKALIVDAKKLFVDAKDRFVDAKDRFVDAKGLLRDATIHLQKRKVIVFKCFPTHIDHFKYCFRLFPSVSSISQDCPMCGIKDDTRGQQVLATGISCRVNGCYMAFFQKQLRMFLSAVMPDLVRHNSRYISHRIR